MKGGSEEGEERKRIRNLGFSSLSAHHSAAQAMEQTANTKDPKHDVKEKCKKSAIFNLWEIEPH
jgi:hypothetical protein